MTDKISAGSRGVRAGKPHVPSAGRLFGVPNEDHYVPEQFTQITKHVSVGERSEFAFFHDQKNRRKILIGVQSLNVAEQQLV